MDKEIEELIASMTKDGKSHADIAKAVSEKFKPKPNEKDEDETEDEDDDEEQDPSLLKKVKKEREQSDKNAAAGKKMETALRFTMGSDKFISEHKSILPKEIAEIFARADKENYDSAIDKANAIRSAVVESFFSLQENLDLLTANQKGQVEDYLKLTKNARQAKAEDVFVNVFEPALEMLKRIKRAEQVGKASGGYREETDGDKLYKEKLMAGSAKQYLGQEKK